MIIFMYHDSWSFMVHESTIYLHNNTTKRSEFVFWKKVPAGVSPTDEFDADGPSVNSPHKLVVSIAPDIDEPPDSIIFER